MTEQEDKIRGGVKDKIKIVWKGKGKTCHGLSERVWALGTWEMLENDENHDMNVESSSRRLKGNKELVIPSG